MKFANFFKLSRYDEYESKFSQNSPFCDSFLKLKSNTVTQNMSLTVQFSRFSAVVFLTTIHSALLGSPMTECTAEVSCDRTVVEYTRKDYCARTLKPLCQLESNWYLCTRTRVTLSWATSSREMGQSLRERGMVTSIAYVKVRSAETPDAEHVITAAVQKRLQQCTTI
jgi:hypothetical protein